MSYVAVAPTLNDVKLKCFSYLTSAFNIFKIIFFIPVICHFFAIANVRASSNSQSPSSNMLFLIHYGLGNQIIKLVTYVIIVTNWVWPPWESASLCSAPTCLAHSLVIVWLVALVSVPPLNSMLFRGKLMSLIHLCVFLFPFPQHLTQCFAYVR